MFTEPIKCSSFRSLLFFLQHLQTYAQGILHQAAVARSILKAIEGQTYICKDLPALKDLSADLCKVHAKFDLSLPRDSQGLVVPDPNIPNLLRGRQKIIRKLTAARHALMIAKQAQRSGIKSLPVYKRGRPGVQSKLRCRVGVSGEKERKRLKARKEFLAAGGSLLLDGTDFFRKTY